MVSQRLIGDPAQYQALQQQEIFCRTQALSYDCQQGDFSFFGCPEGGNYYRSYKPFHALYR